MGLSIIYFKGSQVVPNYNVFLSLRIVFMLTSSVDIDEMLHYVAGISSRSSLFVKVPI